MDLPSLSNLVSKVNPRAFPLFCWLGIRTRSIILKGRGIHKEVGITGVILEAAYHGTVLLDTQTASIHKPFTAVQQPALALHIHLQDLVCSSAPMIT